MDAALYKDAKVSRGFTYHYFYSPAAEGKPTLLLLHGFPSSSFDWHRQVEYFRPKGYGLLVPDLLGAGATSKPVEPEAFRLALIARDVVDLLDAERLAKVVGIAHDWGSLVLARLANLYDDRFHAYIWNAVPYAPPRPQPLDIDTIIAHLQATTGDPRFGYWKFFNEDDAHVVIEQNIDSFVHLVYPPRPELWNEWLTPVGKLKQWVTENRTAEKPSWLTQEEYKVLRETLAKSGIRSALNYYKASVRAIHAQDDQSTYCHSNCVHSIPLTSTGTRTEIPEEAWTIRKPVLWIATTRDAAGAPAMHKAVMEKYVPQAKVVELNVGHWLQFEATERVNTEWESWINNLGL
ncbi:Alpha/Beta hydrolase protein [Trametes polyzona]|nr:Alpha/Beta hydrolase protein [Trametes polyzona]